MRFIFKPKKDTTTNVLLKVDPIAEKIFKYKDNYNVFTPSSYCVARVCKWPLFTTNVEVAIYFIYRWQSPDRLIHLTIYCPENFLRLFLITIMLL